MSTILFNIIKEKVFKDEEMERISLNSTDKKSEWIFDFKSQSLLKVFLEEFARHFWKHFEGKEYDNVQIGGMETGAIALVAGLSLLTPSTKKCNPFYIRKSRKKSGLANLIEGELKKGVPIILVDDVINNARTMRKQIVILEEQGYSVTALFSCIRYRDLSAYQDLIDKGITIFSIFELNDFSRVLPVRNLVSRKELEIISKYTNEYKLTLTDKPNLYLVVPKSSPLLIDGNIYMGTDDGTFYCLKAKDGSIVWTYKVPFGADGKRIFSSPAVYKDNVFFGAYDGNLYCLNRFTGKRKWVFMEGDWVGASPAIDSDRGVVFIGLEFGLINKRGGIVAIDIKTGEAKWKYYKMTGLTHSTPSYNKKKNIVVCGCNDNFLYAFNAKTGDLLWKFETQGEIKYGAVFDDKRCVVIFGSFDGGVYVLNVSDGSLYHRFEARFGFYATPALQGDRIIIGSMDKNVYCFNLKTKITEWVFETWGRIFATPIISGNSVFIGSNDGRLYELDITTGKSLARIQFSERIVNKIQIEVSPKGKRTLYVPTHVCELYKMIEK